MNKRQLKKMVENCVYSEDGITYLSDKQFNNYMDSIAELLEENKRLKNFNKEYRELNTELIKLIDKAVEYCECNEEFTPILRDIIEILKREKDE